MPIRFHPTEVLHSLVEVGNILHMVVHPNQPVRNMRPSPLPPNILRAGQGWSTSRKQTPHLEKNHGAIPPLCGGNLCVAVGNHHPRLNTVGSLDFRLAQQLAAYAVQYPSL